MSMPHAPASHPVKIERKSPWVVAFRRDVPVERRLFCFPYAGGGASIFRRFPESLPPGVEVCAVQLPGREDRYVEPAFSRLPAAVAALAGALHAHLQPPFAFFGHSMGALLAFELTRLLAVAPDAPQPDHLFVSGRRAPHLADRRPCARAWV